MPPWGSPLHSAGPVGSNDLGTDLGYRVTQLTVTGG